MSIAVYGDESGTHNSSEAATICGFAGWKDGWIELSRKWEHYLKLNGVDSFHYTDLKDSKKHPNKYPCYQGWNNKRKDEFVLALAELVSTHTICPVGAHMPAKWVREQIAASGKPTEYPFKQCFDMFFVSVREELWRVLPGCKENILFFFELNNDRRWEEAMNESWLECAKVDTRFTVKPVTGQPKVLVPVQAADLIAGATRDVALPAWQQGLKAGIRSSKRQPMNRLIQTLYRNMPNSAPWMEWEKTSSK